MTGNLNKPRGRGRSYLPTGLRSGSPRAAQGSKFKIPLPSEVVSPYTCHTSSQLWRSLSTLLDRNRDVANATGHSADGFAAFFSRKIDDIRAATADVPPPSVVAQAASSLPSFRPCTTSEVRRIIMTSPVKSCSLDAVPTFLVREFVDVLLPYLTSMVNASLAQGRLPTSQKHAIVTPLLKKTGLDTADMANFRPVSNLTFMSKVVERAVASQLTESGP